VHLVAVLAPVFSQAVTHRPWMQRDWNQKKANNN